MLVLRFRFNNGDIEKAMHIPRLRLIMHLTSLKIHIHAVFKHWFHLHCWTTQHVDLETDVCYRGSKEHLASCQENRDNTKQTNTLIHRSTLRELQQKRAGRKPRRVVGQHNRPEVTICGFLCEEARLFHGEEVKKAPAFFVCLFLFCLTVCTFWAVFCFQCWSSLTAGNWFCRHLDCFFYSEAPKLVVLDCFKAKAVFTVFNFAIASPDISMLKPGHSEKQPLCCPGSEPGGVASGKR